MLLVDYGTEIEISLDDIRYLPRIFFDFPSQAIEARLAVLSPVGDVIFLFLFFDWIINCGNFCILDVDDRCGRDPSRPVRFVYFMGRTV